MTYNVFGGTLSLTLSIYLSSETISMLVCVNRLHDGITSCVSFQDQTD